MEKNDPMTSLSDDDRNRINRMFAGCAEVIGIDHIASAISGGTTHSGDKQLVAYIGLEPSGKAHVAYVVLADTIRDMLEEGVNVIILLADWHAWGMTNSTGTWEKSRLQEITSRRPSEDS